MLLSFFAPGEIAHKARVVRSWQCQCTLLSTFITLVPHFCDLHCIVQNIARAEAAGSAVIVPAEKALKHLTLLSDVDKLFDTALGMYDFGLVTLVAPRTQKDPKEYMPFLKYLQTLNPVRFFAVTSACVRSYIQSPVSCMQSSCTHVPLYCCYIVVVASTLRD